jgi:ubiquinone/menaquinone biosynthesis C-methylase UbiE
MNRFILNRMSTKFTEEKWFATWFDSVYYHTLYSNRDEKEAQVFIEKLFFVIKTPNHSRILDLACGKGRHSFTIANLGMDVLGIDLSPSSIQEASKSEYASLQFVEGDMRMLQFNQEFDVVVNLFTSFGYFENLSDNEKVLDGVKRSLKNGGLFVLDFFNGVKVEKDLVKNESLIRGGVRFDISRKVENGRVIKDIRFDDKGKSHHFQEKVQLIYPQEFMSMLENSGFEIIHTFGTYQLDAFEKATSDRFITISRVK